MEILRNQYQGFLTYEGSAILMALLATMAAVSYNQTHMIMCYIVNIIYGALRTYFEPHEDDRYLRYVMY
jgi:hypothetical protein